MARFQDLVVYQLAEQFADDIWRIVGAWNIMAKDTVGKQLVRAADSVGANIAEGSGRGSYQDNRRFIRIARGSLYESQHWLRRAYRRGLLTKEETAHLHNTLEALAPKLNAYLGSIGDKCPNRRPPPMTNDQ